MSILSRSCGCLLTLVLATLASQQPCVGGYVLVSGFGSSNVAKFDSETGAFLGDLIAPGSGGLSSAEGLVIAPGGQLLVASFSSSQVLRYDLATGSFLGVFANISNPTGMTIGPDGRLYVSSFSGASVARFDISTGAPIDTFVSSGSGGLDAAHGLAFADDGNLYVRSREAVLKYNGSTGASLGTFTSGTGLGFPSGITFGTDGNLYVPSTYLGLDVNNVKRFDATTGAYVDTFIAAGSGGLADPHDVRFLANGTLLVSGDGLRTYSPTTGAFVSQWAAPTLSRPTYTLEVVQEVPEPSSLVLLSLGAIGLATHRVRRSRGE